MELHTAGYNPNNGRYRFDEVISVLRHPYTRQLSPEAGKLEKALTQDNRFYPLPSELEKDEALELLFQPREGNLSLCIMLAEALKRMAKHAISNRPPRQMQPSTSFTGKLCSMPSP